MPKRKYAPRRKFKRRFKRRYYRRKASIARSLKAPVPDKAVAKLRYCETLVLNPTVGSIANHVYRSNDCYDPNVTGVGHQPIGFDQWMGLYNHFYVKGSRITAEFSANADTAAAGTFVAVMHLNASASDTTTNMELIRERTNTVWKAAGPMTGRSVVKLTKSFSHRKFFRKSLFDDDFQGSASGPPNEQAFFYVSVYPADGTSDSFQVPIQITIDYIVEFRERKALGQS